MPRVLLDARHADHETRIDALEDSVAGALGLSSATPQPAGVASAGAGVLASRDDHVHAAQVNITGNAATVTGFSGTHSGASSGTNTGDQTTISGNAGSATTLSAGSDRTKLDGIAAGAAALTSSAPAALASAAAVGAATTAARADHVHTTALPTLTVDTDVLAVDATNNRVGINVASPARTLVVRGSDTGQGVARVGNTHASGISALTLEDASGNNKVDLAYGNSTAALAPANSYLRVYDSEFRYYKDTVGVTSLVLSVLATGNVVMESGFQFGIGTVPSFDFHSSRTVAGASGFRASNLSTTGIGQCAVGNSSSAFAVLEIRSPSEATANLSPVNYATLRGSSATSGVAVHAQATSTPIEFWTNNAGSHAMRGRFTGAGVLEYGGVEVLSQTNTVTGITNKTFTSPTINAGALSGTFSGAHTLSGVVTFGSRNVYLSQNTITAFAGGGQASATALTGEVCFVTTVATIADSVKLPTVVAGNKITVFNLAANSMNVYPQTGGAINALGTNNPIAIAGGASLEFWAQTTTQFRTM